jgi:hypothetical protein
MKDKTEDTSTASVATPPTGGPKFKGIKPKGDASMFDLPSDVFRRFSPGRNKFERWSKFLDLNDETQKELYDYAKKNGGKNKIILRDSGTGAMRMIRGSAVNEATKQAEKSKKKPINDQIFDLISHIGEEMKTSLGDRIVDVLHEFHDQLDELRSQYEKGDLDAKGIADAVFSIEPKLKQKL